MTIYNTHTHIFNTKYVPEFVVSEKISIQTVSKSRPLRWILGTLGRFLPGNSNSKIKRAIKFGEIGLANNQQDIFNTLMDYYRGWEDMKFVVLPMDMEQMQAGSTLSNYRTQLAEIIKIRMQSNLADKLLPFLFIDPRRPEFSNGKDVLDFALKYFEKYGFIGIKLYPALGYFPFDEKLMLLYEWAEKNQVPITSHCIKGIIRYRGDLKNVSSPPAEFATALNTIKYDNLDDYQQNFSEPDNYRFLIKKFPKIKICLAHYGDDSNKIENHPWYKRIKELVSEDNNMYTDVSYTLHNNKIHGVLYNDINSPKLGDKILFGTDYYVVNKAKDEGPLATDFRDFCRKKDVETQKVEGSTFSKIAKDNAKSFLTSSYYTAP